MNPQDDLPTARPPWAVAIEDFGRDYLRDRRSERRWRIFFRLAWLVLFVLIVWAIIAARPRSNLPTGPHTALIEVRGEIASDAEASADHIVSALKSAFEEGSAQAIVLRINSPGGSPVQAGIVNDEIRRLKALHKKKVYAVVEEVCASGAYYVAVAATRSTPTRRASSARSACWWTALASPARCRSSASSAGC
jgi:protease-4